MPRSTLIFLFFFLLKDKTMGLSNSLSRQLKDSLRHKECLASLLNLRTEFEKGNIKD